VPLGLIEKLENGKHKEKQLDGFFLGCKDFRTISIFFVDSESVEMMASYFKKYLFPLKIR